ncbi:MAG TPA: DUF5995 family protein [Jatrophihabitantaceae bacterium]|jgi:hypothetical protein
MADAVDRVAQAMTDRRAGLPAEHLRFFLDTYQRTTRAVGAAVDAGRFEDPDWVQRWDVAFAELYLAALDAPVAPRPWRLAFSAPPELPPLRHVLLGVNAHVNYDLPQALLAVISDPQFGDAMLMAARQRDHERIDGVLSSRVGAEDAELSAFGKTLLDRVLTPLNRLSSKRFLRESRQKVWHNTLELQQARVAGETAYRTRLAELELLSAARIADLLAPGPVLLRLAVAGFGVVLPPP